MWTSYTEGRKIEVTLHSPSSLASLSYTDMVKTSQTNQPTNLSVCCLEPNRKSFSLFHTLFLTNDDIRYYTISDTHILLYRLFLDINMYTKRKGQRNSLLSKLTQAWHEPSQFLSLSSSIVVVMCLSVWLTWWHIPFPDATSCILSLSLLLSIRGISLSVLFSSYQFTTLNRTNIRA